LATRLAVDLSPRLGGDTRVSPEPWREIDAHAKYCYYALSCRSTCVRQKNKNKIKNVGQRKNVKNVFFYISDTDNERNARIDTSASILGFASLALAAFVVCLLAYVICLVLVRGEVLPAFRREVCVICSLRRLR